MINFAIDEIEVYLFLLRIGFDVFKQINSFVFAGKDGFAVFGSPDSVHPDAYLCHSVLLMGCFEI